MIKLTKLALVGLLAVTAVEFSAPSTATAQSSGLCINKPAMSLTDQTTDNEEALQRVDSLGNHCYRATATGRRVTPDRVMQFLQSNPDARDQQYGGNQLVTPDN